MPNSVERVWLDFVDISSGVLEKSLTVLVDVVIEGRRNSANIVKYIKMAASSNFGNILTVLV